MAAAPKPGFRRLWRCFTTNRSSPTRSSGMAVPRRRISRAISGLRVKASFTQPPHLSSNCNLLLSCSTGSAATLPFSSRRLAHSRTAKARYLRHERLHPSAAMGQHGRAEHRRRQQSIPQQMARNSRIHVEQQLLTAQGDQTRS